MDYALIYNNESELNETFEKIRCYCNGQSTRFTDVLPKHLRHLPDDEKAKYITEQILFSLSYVNPTLDEGALIECQHWINGIIRYLMVKCPVEDFLFCNIPKLYKLNVVTRFHILGKHVPENDPLILQVEPPDALKSFDMAVIHLLCSCGLERNITESKQLLDKALFNMKFSQELRYKHVI